MKERLGPVRDRSAAADRCRTGGDRLAPPDTREARRIVTSECVGLIEPDDHLRDDLSRALGDRGFEVVFEVADPGAGVEGTRWGRLDLVVVGVPLPVTSARDVLHRIWAASPRALTVVHGRGPVPVDPALPQIADAYVQSWHGPSSLADAVTELRRGHCHAASVCLPHTVGAAQEARVRLRALAAHWGGPRASDEAEIVVSELVTNAYRHGEAPIELRVSIADGCLRLVVSDRGAALPTLVPFEARGTHGRGLALVEALAQAWGLVGRPDGKDVWALLGKDDSA